MKTIATEKTLNRHLRPVLRGGGTLQDIFEKTGPTSTQEKYQKTSIRTSALTGKKYEIKKSSRRSKIKPKKIINSQNLLIKNPNGILWGKNHSLMLDVITNEILREEYGDKINNKKEFNSIIRKNCPIDVDFDGERQVTVSYKNIREVAHFKKMQSRDFETILTKISTTQISMNHFYYRLDKSIPKPFINYEKIIDNTLFDLIHNPPTKTFHLYFKSNLGLLWYRNCVDLFVNWFPHYYSWLDARTLFFLKKYCIPGEGPPFKREEINKFLGIENYINRATILKKILEILKLNRFILDYKYHYHHITLETIKQQPSFNL